jgi:WD40-like Beta Propeller Repeat
MKKKHLLTLVLIFGVMVLSIGMLLQDSLPALLPMDAIHPKIKHSLAFPPINYDRLISVDGKLLALVLEQSAGDTWRYLSEGDQVLKQINLPEDAKCTEGTTYDGFLPRPDGLFDLRELCQTQQELLVYLMAYDWHTGNLSEITGPLPSRAGSGFETWNSTLSRGIMDMRGYSYETLYWIWPGGFGPMDLTITGGNGPWNLKDDFPDYQGAELGKTGNASFPAWSPNGNTITFFASPDSLGKTGADRFYTKYNLYLMDSEKLQPKSVVGGFAFPYIAKWSPDSQWIAFTADRGIFSRSGVWLYSPAANKLLLLSEGDFQYIYWQPDGHNLAVIRCKTTDDCPLIEDYDLTGIVGP